MRKIATLLVISSFSSLTAMEVPQPSIRIEVIDRTILPGSQRIFEKEFGKETFGTTQKRIANRPSVVCLHALLEDAEQGHQVVGFLIYEKDYMNHACISHVAVDENHRRKKIGTALMSFLEKTSGCIGIKVQAVQQALPFYERFGFQKSTFNMLYKPVKK